MHLLDLDTWTRPCDLCGRVRAHIGAEDAAPPDLPGAYRWRTVGIPYSRANASADKARSFPDINCRRPWAVSGSPALITPITAPERRSVMTISSTTGLS